MRLQPSGVDHRICCRCVTNVRIEGPNVGNLTSSRSSSQEDIWEEINEVQTPRAKPRTLKVAAALAILLNGWIALLIQGIESEDPGFSIRANADWINANNGVFLGAKGANTRLVDRDRSPQNRITDVDSPRVSSRAGCKAVTALAAAGRVSVVGQHGVDQAGRRRTGNAGCAQGAAQVYQRRSVTHR